MFVCLCFREEKRRTKENIIRVLLSDSRFPQMVADSKFPPTMSKKKQSKEVYCSAGWKREDDRIWSYFWDYIADLIQTWFDGFEVLLPSGRPVYIRMICCSVICDLPQITDLTGQVSKLTSVLKTSSNVFKCLET